MTDISLNSVAADTLVEKLARLTGVPAEDIAGMVDVAVLASGVGEDAYAAAAFDGAEGFFKAAGLSEPEQAALWAGVALGAGVDVEGIMKQAEGEAPQATPDLVQNPARQAELDAGNTRAMRMYGAAENVADNRSAVGGAGIGAGLAGLLYGGLFPGRDEYGERRSRLRSALGKALLFGSLGALGSAGYHGFKGWEGGPAKYLAAAADTYGVPAGGDAEALERGAGVGYGNVNARLGRFATQLGSAVSRIPDIGRRAVNVATDAVRNLPADAYVPRGSLVQAAVQPAD